ncbi:MAG TPA: hypothetical protein VE999_14420 [Gemmataceae bacterium]|nr:hypothetical protein [Gemmataceae bacterium]
MQIKGLVHYLVLAGMLAIGFLVVWGLIAFWAVQVGTHVVAGISPHSVMIRVRSVLFFLPDGTPVIGYQESDRHRVLRDLQGSPVAEPDGVRPFLTHATLPAKPVTPSLEDELSWDQRINSFADGRVPHGFWYFVTDGRRDGSGYFVGYDSENRSCLGYLGLGGFKESPLPNEERIPFAGPASGPQAGLQGRLLCNQTGFASHPHFNNAGRAGKGSVSSWDVYVHSRDGKLYHADLQKRTIHVAFDRSPFISAALTAGVFDAVHGLPYRPAVRTADAVLVLDEHGGMLKRFPIPASLRERDINFAETSTGGAVMYAETPEDLFTSEVEYHICRLDSEGRSWEATTVLPFLDSDRFILTAAGFVIPSPLGLAGTVGTLRTWMLLDFGLATTYPEALGQALTEFRSAFAIAQLLAFGFAVLCYRRQVRYGASRAERIIWPLFVLVLGLPGWIGYRFGRSWPVLETCPECFVNVPRDREHCVRCTNDFPRPALKGTEVFA